MSNSKRPFNIKKNWARIASAVLVAGSIGVSNTAWAQETIPAENANATLEDCAINPDAQKVIKMDYSIDDLGYQHRIKYLVLDCDAMAALNAQPLSESEILSKPYMVVALQNRGAVFNDVRDDKGNLIPAVQSFEDGKLNRVTHFQNGKHYQPDEDTPISMMLDTRTGQVVSAYIFETGSDGNRTVTHLNEEQLLVLNNRLQDVLTVGLQYSPDSAPTIEP